jgi:all-trans-retinol 13,14-reductase
MGGNLYVNAGVDEIIIHKNKIVGVRLEKGEEIYAPIIISSAGVVNTFDKLLRNSPKYNNYKLQLKTVTPTPSYVCLYMGLKNSPEEMQTQNTNLWIYPGYNHDKNLNLFLQNQKEDFPLVYISFPSAKDPEYKRKNPTLSTMEAITVAPFEQFGQWKDKSWKKRGAEYEKVKEIISQRILKEVYKHVPKAQGAMDYYELSTPLSVKSLANYQQGDLYGINHTPERFRQKWIRANTDIKNLYLTGQDVITVGVTSALFSGLLTASVILKKNLMKELLNS